MAAAGIRASLLLGMRIDFIVQVVDKCGDKAVEFDTKALGEGIQTQRNTFFKKTLL